MLCSCATAQRASKDAKPIICAADRLAEYQKYLQKPIALVVNQTSLVNNGIHLVDYLAAEKVDIKVIFAPEHGFRGKADAGEHVDDSHDAKTGAPIVSLYGKKRAPDSSDLQGVETVIFDIQDVGVRFYTYISTLQAVMESCAKLNKTLVILDRPNPNGHYVDGPILESSFKSFIGMQPIPIVYGMTMGEYATMLNAQHWLTNGVQCKLKVITCKNYTHKRIYAPPVKPSPNLPNLRSILLYPSLCFFEGTDVSVGRGTDKQFQIYGNPKFMEGDYFFTPQPNEGSKEPPHLGKRCRGFDLSQSNELFFAKPQINLQYLLEAYAKYPQKDSFFLKSNFFEKLAGTAKLREQVKNQVSIAEIRASWAKDLVTFKRIRKKYLLYRDFE